MSVSGAVLNSQIIDEAIGRSLEALGHEFYVSIVERSLQKQCKNLSKKFAVRPKGEAVALSPPPPLSIRHWISVIGFMYKW